MRGLSMAVASLAALVSLSGLSGCASGRVTPPQGPAQATIDFENLTVDVIRVYLRQGARDYLLGRVGAGRRAALPVPGVLVDGGDSYTIAVLPVGAPNSGQMPSTRAREPLLFTPAPIRVLLDLTWTLQGDGLNPRTRGSAD